ncbi:branched-chain amino acid ABC transporter permease [Salinibacterium sp. ZJ454]|uniref:branched-chain amino acid ABC transporter permease n=1 Tax=Salinibacterium sp. ZJ454 TaxID=2708339 RepID=UPI00141FD878|nr:branched-chain amino acid ABC transporter permease [Salinibacterium sp. ZJ454]
MEDFLQLTINGVFRGAFYGALGAGLALILGVTGRFHFSYALTYTVAPFAAYGIAQAVGLSFWPAALVGVLAAVLLSVAIELLIYRPVAARAGANTLLAVMVSSLGFSIVGVALLQLLLGSGSVPFYGPPLQAITLGPVLFTNFDLFQAITSVVLVLALTGLLVWTPIGRSIRATRSNPQLAGALGIRTSRINIVVFAIGGLITGVCAIWYGLQYTVDPIMGDRVIIYSFVVAFLAGTRSSPLRALAVGAVVALLEQWATLVLSVQWSQTAVFLVLVVYMIALSTQRIWRPWLTNRSRATA